MRQAESGKRATRERARSSIRNFGFPAFSRKIGGLFISVATWGGSEDVKSEAEKKTVTRVAWKNRKLGGGGMPLATVGICNCTTAQGHRGFAAEHLLQTDCLLLAWNNLQGDAIFCFWVLWKTLFAFVGKI